MLTCVCIWILIPPFNGLSIIAAVVSIELSQGLFLANSAFFGLALWRYRGPFRVAVAITLAFNAIVCAIPTVALLGAHAGAFGAVPASAQAVRQMQIPIRMGAETSAIQAYLPSARGPLPVVFAIYGGAWRNGSPRNDRTLNRDLARQGYAVFALDYRHSPKYRFPAALDDVRSEIAMILRDARNYDLDAGKVAVLGHSSGGELAELLAFEPSSRVQALVSYSGAVDLTMGWKYPPEPDPIGVRKIIEDYIGARPSAAARAYDAATPLLHVHRGVPPALLLYGTRDHVVDIRYARKFRDALTAAGTRVTFLELPWAEHAFEDVPYGLHYTIAYTHVVAFLSDVFAGRR